MKINEKDILICDICSLKNDVKNCSYLYFKYGRRKNDVRTKWIKLCFECQRSYNTWLFINKIPITK